MKPTTATILREIDKFQEETGMPIYKISLGAGLGISAVCSWQQGHWNSSARSRKAIRTFIREYSEATPKTRELPWDDDFVSAYQSASAFKVETPVHPGILQRIVAPVRKLFSRGEAA